MKNEKYTTKDAIKDFLGIFLIFFIYWLIMMFINIIEPVTEDYFYGDPSDAIELNYQEQEMQYNGNDY